MKYLLLLLLLLIIACGKRTTSNQSTYFKSDSLSVENSRILSQNIRLNDIGELVPFDNSKPMIIDGKYYYNAIIKYDKSKFEDFKIDDNIKVIEIKKENKTEDKQKDKSDNTILYALLFFIFSTFVFLYLKTPNLRIKATK
jgi:hypothetical protein